MKKVLVVLSLMLFTGSLATSAFAASNGTSVEIKKNDDKKKKKKSKKGSSCCAAKTGDTKTGEAKSGCCAAKKAGTTETK